METELLNQPVVATDATVITVNGKTHISRKAKDCQKMAGSFRKESGNEMYCAILTIIETLKRGKMGMMKKI